MSVMQGESWSRDESGMSQWEVIKGPERRLEEPEQPEQREKPMGKVPHAPHRILIRNALYIQITYQVLRGQREKISLFPLSLLP